VCSMWVGLEIFVLVGLGSCGFVWWVSFFLCLGCFFSFSSIAFSLVYCRYTKGRLTLLIKPGYYLLKKRDPRRIFYLRFSILCIFGEWLFCLHCSLVLLIFLFVFLFLDRRFLLYTSSVLRDTLRFQ